MKGYKGFNQDMTCRGFQYEQGKTYELAHPEAVLLCHIGFHFCEKLTDCFEFYDKFDSRFCEIEADGNIKSDGKKSACSRITIGRELSGIELNRLIYGNGYGNGYGYGDGYGYGNGYGYGDGYGDGYGYGDGNGYGNGYGDGNGYGKNIQKILNFSEV